MNLTSCSFHLLFSSVASTSWRKKKQSCTCNLNIATVCACVSLFSLTPVTFMYCRAQWTSCQALPCWQGLATENAKLSISVINKDYGTKIL